MKINWWGPQIDNKNSVSTRRAEEKERDREFTQAQVPDLLILQQISALNLLDTANTMSNFNKSNN